MRLAPGKPKVNRPKILRKASANERERAIWRNSLRFLISTSYFSHWMFFVGLLWTLFWSCLTKTKTGHFLLKISMFWISAMGKMCFLLWRNSSAVIMPETSRISHLFAPENSKIHRLGKVESPIAPSSLLRLFLRPLLMWVPWWPAILFSGKGFHVVTSMPHPPRTFHMFRFRKRNPQEMTLIP